MIDTAVVECEKLGFSLNYTFYSSLVLVNKMSQCSVCPMKHTVSIPILVVELTVFSPSHC